MTIKRGSSLAFINRYRYGSSSLSSSGVETFSNTYEMYTENNRGWKHLGGSRRNVGGAFKLKKYTVSVDPAFRNNTSNARKFKGYCYCTGINNGDPFPPLNYVSDGTLFTQGTTAISRCLPTNPSSNFATFTGELFGGIPRFIGSSLFRDQVKELRKMPGDEYLNIQFGWLPLVSDLRKFGSAVKNHKKILDQYIADSDRKIKRRYVYPPTLTQSSATGTGIFGPAVGYVQMTGQATESRINESKTWFEGAFRYHIPVSSSGKANFATYESYANKLFGTRITPEVVWNLAPWSWMADWFGNAGDVMKNISALGSDGLAMQYGYMMHSNSARLHVSASATSSGSLGSSPGSVASQVTKTWETKQRVPASPYGFGLLDADLTSQQKAVILALGISHLT